MNWVRGETVGHGSFGKVSLAVAGSGPPSVVVKSCGASSVGSLLNEKVVLDELQGCPEVVRCLGDGYTFENGERMYNVLLEFASLGALSENLKISENRRFQEGEIRGYSRALLRGLKFIHRAGFVHCDIKLQNVLLCGDGRVKIADFGLAKRAGERSLGCELRGTPMYMSPEMVNGGEQGAPADVWALGCAVVEMASGAPAWKYSDVAGLFMRIGVGDEVPGFPGELSDQGRDFLEKCFIKDPRKRWTAEMLLNHPFGADDHRDGGGTVALSKEYSPSAPSPSPRCPFDFPEWVSGEESPLAAPSPASFSSPGSEQSPASRLQGMFGHKFFPNWTPDSDGWVNVR
ncbi:unnamed protein product [Cuscuta campestris]|uniref:Protein kinase domain-containing protein n=1 Tax=Cuscuta campestris TaxID=132261 RepID=A0A484MC29_9ASTE|nr:unnamed protein product [Cuscuta campestris]